MKSFDEIKEIYDANAQLFDLDRFQNKFLKLIRRWSEMVLPTPELAKFGYGSIAPPVVADNKENISSLGSDDMQLHTSLLTRFLQSADRSLVV